MSSRKRSSRRVSRKRAKAKPSGPVRKPWALLAYIAGDNNLSDAGLADIVELCEVGASPRVHVAVEIDTYGEYTGSLRYEITEPDWSGKAHRIVIERIPEKDTGDPEALRSFLDWGLMRYPADNYLVVVWNHGTGFRAIRRDIGYDDFGSSLDMPEIEEAMRRAGIGDKLRIRILGFDACLMNMVEIAHHFASQVDIIVGSQQTEPGDGWPYDEVLKAVKDAGDEFDLARRIVNAYIEDYRKLGIYDVTHSAVECARTEAVIKALGDLGDLLAYRLDAYYRDIRRLRLEAQTFEMADYVDLIHLAQLLGRGLPDGAIRKAADDVIKHARACIIASSSLGQGVANANGLSVWFPASASVYQNYRGKYLALKFAASHRGWIHFLDAYHSS